jgi:CoA-dependent NAD(P)H sulfur oxidoreductase
MKIVVVGATAGGTTFAAKMRRNNREAEIILLEKGELTSLGACGLPFFVGDFFEDPDRMIARTPEEFIQSGIDMRVLHEAVQLDARRKVVVIKDLQRGVEYEESYDELVIATGAQVAPLPFSVASEAIIYPLRLMEDGLALRKAMLAKSGAKVSIIGAGFIGIEVVEAALHLGHEVSLIDVMPKPMASTLDEEFQNLIHEELQAHGVQGYYGAFVKGILADQTILLTDGRSIASDIIVWAGGIKPTTDWLVSSGIRLERGVVQTNRNAQSSLDSVYAIGDCAMVHNLVTNEAMYSPLATVANKLGRFLADYLAGLQEDDFAGMLGSASLKACDLEVVRVGLSENEAKKMGLNYHA